MNLNNFIFQAWPRRLETQDYEKTVQKYLSKVINGDVVCIQQIGSVSAPGISDTDLIVVLKNEINKAQSDRYSMDGMDENERYVMMHNVFVIPEALAKDVKQVIPNIEKSRCRYGQNMFSSQVVCTSETARDSTVANIVDYSMDIMLVLLESIRNKRIYVRPLLCVLYSLKYTLAQYSSLEEGEVEDAGIYIERIVQLRDRIFEMKKEAVVEELLSLVLKAIEVISRVWFRINTMMSDHIQLNLSEVDFAWRTYHNYRTMSVMRDGFTASGVLTDIMGSQDEKHGHAFIRHLPVYGRIIDGNIMFPISKSLYHQYLVYASFEGIISHELRKRMFIKASMKYKVGDSSYTKVLLKRAAFFNGQGEFLLRNGFDYGQLLLYNYFPSRKRLPNRIVEGFIKWHLSHRRFNGMS